MGKTGWIYILDRRNGKPILGIPERKVPQSATQHTWPTQPIPNGEPFAAQCADKDVVVEVEGSGRQAGQGRVPLTPYNEKQYTAFAPTALGGVDWPPSSYSSKTGYMYVCSKDSSGAWKALPRSKAGKLKPLGNFFQIEGLFQPKGSPAPEVVGRVVAMNMRTNRRVWSVPFRRGDMCYSGDHVDRRRSRVRRPERPAAPGLRRPTRASCSGRRRSCIASVAAPPMTYTVDGKQFVAVYAGGNGIAAGSGKTKVKYGSDLYTFAIPG